MTSSLSPAQFSALPDTAAWRVRAIPGAAGLEAVARFPTGSFELGVALVRRIGEIADAANHHPDVELTYPAVAVRLTTHDAGSRVTTRDAAVAGAISQAAASLGMPAPAARNPLRKKDLELITRRRLGTIATTHADGRPQLSTVIYAYADGVIRVSVTDTRVKVKNLRRDPRMAMHIAGESGFDWAAAEGIAELGPVAGDPGDAVVEELIDIYRSVGGEHPDWDEFRAAMVAEHRLVLRLPILRTWGS